MSQYEVFGRKVQAVANTALLVTPIVSRQNPPSVDALGSGLFLRVDDDFFLITAGHLLNLEDWRDLLVPGNSNNMIWLNGIVATTFDRPNLRSNIDFAVLRFSERQVKHLIGGHYGTVKPHNILINHKLKFDDNYVVAGYPVTGVKKHYGKPVFEPIPLKLVTYPIQTKKYSRFGYNTDHHILVKYQRKLKPFESQRTIMTRKPVGVSGSGLWFVPDWNKLSHGVPEFFLTGLMIEVDGRGFMAALRIDFVIEAIRQIFNKGHLGATRFKVGDSIKTLFCAEIP